MADVKKFLFIEYERHKATPLRPNPSIMWFRIGSKVHGPLFHGFIVQGRLFSCSIYGYKPNYWKWYWTYRILLHMKYSQWPIMQRIAKKIPDRYLVTYTGYDNRKR